MNENFELLEYIYKDANMGCESMTTLIKSIHGRDNKIKNVVEDILKSYEKFLLESKKLLEKNKIELKEENPMAKMNAWMGVKMEVMKDNSDSSIAGMLIQGLTMGTINMEKRIEDYKENTNKDILKLAKDFHKFQADAINDLKKYL